MIEIPPSLDALRDGPMTLREITAASAKVLDCNQYYDDVLAVLMVLRDEGRVVRISSGGDYRNHVWKAV